MSSTAKIAAKTQVPAVPRVPENSGYQSTAMTMIPISAFQGTETQKPKKSKFQPPFVGRSASRAVAIPPC